MKRWPIFVIAGIVLAGIAIVILLAGVFFLGRRTAPVEDMPAKQAVQPSGGLTSAIPGCEPPESKRCQQQAGGAEEFDWGEGPQFPGIGQLLKGQPTPVPSGAQKVYQGVRKVPIVGDVMKAGEKGLGLLATILKMAGWAIQNLPLVLIALVVGAMLLKFPVFAPMILLWELAESLWERRKPPGNRRKTAGKVWNGFLKKRKKGGIK